MWRSHGNRRDSSNRAVSFSECRRDQSRCLAAGPLPPLQFTDLDDLEADLFIKQLRLQTTSDVTASHVGSSCTLQQIADVSQPMQGVVTSPIGLQLGVNPPGDPVMALSPLPVKLEVSTQLHNPDYKLADAFDTTVNHPSKRQQRAISFGQVEVIHDNDNENGTAVQVFDLPQDAAGLSVKLKLDEQIPLAFDIVADIEPPLVLYHNAVPDNIDSTAFMRHKWFVNAATRLTQPWTTQQFSLIDHSQVPDLHPFAKVAADTFDKRGEAESFYLYPDGSKCCHNREGDIDDTDKQLTWAVTIVSRDVCGSHTHNTLFNPPCYSGSVQQDGEIELIAHCGEAFCSSNSLTHRKPQGGEFSFRGVFGGRLYPQDTPPGDYRNWQEVQQALADLTEGNMLCTVADVPEAEMTALVWSMLWCLAHAMGRNCPVYSDCLMTVQYINGTASFEADNYLAKLMVNVADLFKRSCAGKVAHIKGHSGNPWNEMADSVPKAIGKNSIHPS